jgi:hypothetical protein
LPERRPLSNIAPNLGQELKPLFFKSYQVYGIVLLATKNRLRQMVKNKGSDMTFSFFLFSLLLAYTKL